MTKSKDQIIRNVVLSPKEFKIIMGVVDNMGLGGKGFSAALRHIIRDWDFIQRGGREGLPSQSIKILDPADIG